MKKCFLTILAVMTFAIFGLSAGEASTSVDSPFPLQSPDQSWTLDVTDLGNGIDHGVVFYNNVSHTAIGVVLDSLGNPDNTLLGSHFLAADFSISPAPLWTSNEETSLVTSPYPAGSPDSMQLFAAAELNSFNHGVIFYNNVSHTAMAVVLDPNGVPDNLLLGYAFIAADLNRNPIFMWGSHDGLAWYCMSGCNQ